MIKPCIVYYVILLIMISLAFVAKADHDDDRNKRDLLGVFIFGDSEVDAGNNNYFFTLAKGNNRPNGIDFKPSGGNPTGRYTNGRTPPDIIGRTCVKFSSPFFFFSFFMHINLTYKENFNYIYIFV